jgi:hypothetical protein
MYVYGIDNPCVRESCMFESGAAAVHYYEGNRAGGWPVVLRPVLCSTCLLAHSPASASASTSSSKHSAATWRRLTPLASVWRKVSHADAPLPLAALLQATSGGYTIWGRPVQTDVPRLAGCLVSSTATAAATVVISERHPAEPALPPGAAAGQSNTVHRQALHIQMDRTERERERERESGR